MVSGVVQVTTLFTKVQIPGGKHNMALRRASELVKKRVWVQVAFAGR